MRNESGLRLNRFIPRLGGPDALRNAGGLISASALNSGVAFAVTLAAAGALSVADFGVFGLCVAVANVIFAVADGGSGLTLVRHVGRRPNDAPAAATAIIGWKLIVAVALLVLGLALPDAALALLLPPLDGQRALFLMTLLAAGLLGLWSSARALDQAREDFAALRRALVACAVLRAAAFVGLLSTGTLTPLTALASIYVIPFALLLVGRAGCHLKSADWSAARRTAATLMRYGAWVGASSMCYMAFTRAPMLMAAHEGTPEALGVLGGAMTLMLACTMLADALRTVALPRIMRARNRTERAAVRAWLNRTTRPILVLGAVGVVAVVPFYQALLGPAHAEGAILLLILGGATLLAADLGLHNALLHAHGRPQLAFRINVLRLLALALLAAVIPMTPLSIACAYASVLVGGEIMAYVAVRRLDRGGSEHLLETGRSGSPLTSS